MSRLTIEFDTAPMSLHDVSDDGETQAGTLEIPRETVVHPIKPLKHA